MGQAYSYVLDTAEREFARVQKTDGHHAGQAITYSQLRRMQFPEDYAPDTRHLAVVFCMDFNRDGRFSYDDMRNFINWAADAVPAAHTDDFTAQLEARCLIKLWTCVRHSTRGNDVFAEWLLLLLERTYPAYVQRPRAERVDNLDNDTSSTSSGSDGEDPGKAESVASSSPEEVVAAAQLHSAGGEVNRASDEGRRFGPPCVALLYDVLRLDAVYGLDFGAFAGLVVGASDGGPGPQVVGEPAAAGSSSTASSVTAGSRSRASSTCSSDADTATFFGDAAAQSGGTAASVLASFDTPRDGGDTASLENDAPRPWADEMALRVFIDAFAHSMWATMHRLGLNVLSDDAV